MIEYMQNGNPLNCRVLKISIVLLLTLFFALSIEGQGFITTRINNSQPIITQKLFIDLGAGTVEGENINGPSLIRIPDWIAPENRADSSAVYYLYFAHHQGNYIRLAWAVDLEGPWNLYKTGSDYKSGNRGVLDLGEDDIIYVGNSVTIEKHIASPDVIVDDSNKQIVMYFHGPVEGPEGQRTFVSTSSDGLSFLEGILPVMLGGSYFRVFEYRDRLYSIDNRADIYKGGTVDDPWLIPPDFNFLDKLWTEREDNPFQDDINQDPAIDGSDLRLRHVGVHVSEDTLFVFYSRIADAPERILLSVIRLDNRTFYEWDPGYPPQEILYPDELWEGKYFAILPSESGSSKVPVKQLRDPDIFEDNDGSLYLLYAGRGEDAIGLARLERTYGHPVHNKNIKYGLITPDFEVFNDLNAGKVLFRIRSAGDTRYEIRIYSTRGRLVDIVKGRCLEDGSVQATWVPHDIRHGIFIANLITNNHSVSVKFNY